MGLLLRQPSASLPISHSFAPNSQAAVSAKKKTPPPRSLFTSASVVGLRNRTRQSGNTQTPKYTSEHTRREHARAGVVYKLVEVTLMKRRAPQAGLLSLFGSLLFIIIGTDADRASFRHHKSHAPVATREAPRLMARHTRTRNAAAAAAATERQQA